MDICSPPTFFSCWHFLPSPLYTHNSHGHPSAPCHSNQSHNPTTPAPKPVIVASTAISIPLSNTDGDPSNASVTLKVPMVPPGKPHVPVPTVTKQALPVLAFPIKVSIPSQGTSSPTSGTLDLMLTSIISASTKRQDSKNSESVEGDKANNSAD
ncbi:hypothetical protein C0989_002453 [Termitomyces sp. Mn162]|nr:hypothetical protein C0989_002453 [Termitomyces sp. Mn162]KAH0588370.1 hypothetical protein H2248_004227 [Termitomyces sp. 'cryptogamus']